MMFHPNTTILNSRSKKKKKEERWKGHSFGFRSSIPFFLKTICVENNIMAIKWTFHYDFLNDIYSGVNCFYPNIINFWPLISEYVCLLRWRAKTFEGANLGIFVFCLTPWEWARVLYCKYAGLGLLTVSSSISSVVISNMSKQFQLHNFID